MARYLSTVSVAGKAPVLFATDFRHGYGKEAHVATDINGRHSWKKIITEQPVRRLQNSSQGLVKEAGHPPGADPVPVCDHDGFQRVLYPDSTGKTNDVQLFCLYRCTRVACQGAPRL